MSKRIMNEVITLAEDEKLNIWYQDTDSIHINYEDVSILEQKFKQTYGRELVGNDMGQFHIDFTLEGAKGEIYAIESLFLAKKVYIDKLESVDENNNIIHSYHIRLKSVPTSCVNHTCKMLECDPMELYKQLYKPGVRIEFDLTESGKNCGFKFQKDLSVRSYNDGEFVRCIGFSEDTQRIEIT